MGVFMGVFMESVYGECSVEFVDSAYDEIYYWRGVLDINIQMQICKRIILRILGWVVDASHILFLKFTSHRPLS